MKTKYEHIYFEKDNDDPVIWDCHNNKGYGVLGFVDYYKVWKQFVFNSADCAVFSNDCLDDISHFLKQLNAERSGDETK